MKTLKQLLEEHENPYIVDKETIVNVVKEWLTQKLPKYGANGKNDDKFAFPEDVIKELIKELQEE